MCLTKVYLIIVGISLAGCRKTAAHGLKYKWYTDYGPLYIVVSRAYTIGKPLYICRSDIEIVPRALLCASSINNNIFFF